MLLRAQPPFCSQWHSTVVSVKTGYTLSIDYDKDPVSKRNQQYERQREGETAKATSHSHQELTNLHAIEPLYA